MSLVRFATICDKCGKRSPEFEFWYTCTDCRDDVCNGCTTTAKEDEGQRSCVCFDCESEINKEDQ